MKTYGVIFKTRGKIYFFNYEGDGLKIDDKVIVETDNGQQMGTIAKVFSEPNYDDNIKNIIRKATKKDMETYDKNKNDAQKALTDAQNKAKELDLAMKFLEANFSFDRKQLLLKFIADERIDFRQLAKELAGIYKTRIELRQVGVRDKAKEVGGIGQCGRKLCCAGFLNNVGSISINMVKNQNIAINPSKINGQCGRLLCCLTYEDDEYQKCRKGMPHVGQKLTIDGKEATVVSIDILNRKYKVDVDGIRKEIELNDEKSTK